MDIRRDNVVPNLVPLLARLIHRGGEIGEVAVDVRLDPGDQLVEVFKRNLERKRDLALSALAHVGDLVLNAAERAVDVVHPGAVLPVPAVVSSPRPRLGDDFPYLLKILNIIVF